MDKSSLHESWEGKVNIAGPSNLSIHVSQVSTSLRCVARTQVASCNLPSGGKIFSGGSPMRALLPPLPPPPPPARLVILSERSRIATNLDRALLSPPLLITRYYRAFHRCLYVAARSSNLSHRAAAMRTAMRRFNNRKGGGEGGFLASEMISLEWRCEEGLYIGLGL